MQVVHLDGLDGRDDKAMLTAQKLGEWLRFSKLCVLEGYAVFLVDVLEVCASLAKKRCVGQEVAERVVVTRVGKNEALVEYGEEASSRDISRETGFPLLGRREGLHCFFVVEVELLVVRGFVTDEISLRPEREWVGGGFAFVAFRVAHGTYLKGTRWCLS